MRRKKCIQTGVCVTILVLGLCFLAIPEEMHYPPYAVPLVIRLQDPVGTAMGLTGAAYRSGPLSALTNPAGLADLDFTALSGVHVPAQDQFLIPENRPQYLNQESLALGLPFHGWVFGGMFLYYNLGGSSEGQENGSSSSTFVRLYQASCSRRFALRENLLLSAGLNVKRIENCLVHKQGVGYSGDIGFQIRFFHEKRTISAGFSVSNLGPDIRYKLPLDTEYETPMQLLRAGAACQVNHPVQRVQAEILAAVEYQRNLNQAPHYFQIWEKLGGGVEVRVFSVLYIRMGGVLDLRPEGNSDSIEGATFGFGFHTQIPFESLPPLYLKLDYGRGLNISDLNQNMISLTLGYDIQRKNLTGF